MAAKNWAALRFRAEGGDDPNADAEPQFLEVTNLEGLPVRVVGDATQPPAYDSVLVAASALVKSGPGVLHSITLMQNDAAPTAGTIIVYDNFAASGKQLFNWTLTTAVFYPTTVILDARLLAGLYIAFTTTADVNVTLTYA